MALHVPIIQEITGVQAWNMSKVYKQEVNNFKWNGKKNKLLKKKKNGKERIQKKSLRTFMDLPLLRLPPETEITFSPGAFEKIPRE